MELDEALEKAKGYLRPSSVVLVDMTTVAELLDIIGPLVAAAEAGRWRPIEDGAPKDGTRVLLYHPAYKRSCIAAWRSNSYIGLGWTTDEGESATLTFDLPTHWRPLPPAPEA